MNVLLAKAAFPLRLAGIGLAVFLANGTIRAIIGSAGSNEGKHFTCRDNLKYLTQGLFGYPKTHQGNFPATWEELARDVKWGGPVYEFHLCCSGVYDRYTWHPWWQSPPDGCPSHYALEKGLKLGMPGRYILAYDGSTGNHADKSRNILFLNGYIENWPAEREPEFQRCLQAQRRALAEEAAGNTVTQPSDKERDGR